MLVMKFGGSSVANAQRIATVRDLVFLVSSNDEPLFVVCSALSGVTDLLLKAAHKAGQRDESYLESLQTIILRHKQTSQELTVVDRVSVDAELQYVLDELSDVLRGIYLLGECTNRSKDLVASFGERLSCYLVAEAIRPNESTCQFVDARTLIKTDQTFQNAVVQFDETNQQILTLLHHPARVHVITGFIGSTELGETTTLGRGGSDYTASIIGAALDVDEIQIWTDVDGVLTADPRIVSSVQRIETMSYEEAMEMSHFGAKVIYAPTMQPALESGIPIRIMNTFHPDCPGTVIGSSVTEESSGRFVTPVTGISSINEMAFLRVYGSGLVGVTGTAGRLFDALAHASINIIMITQGSSEHSICFAVKPEDAQRSVEAIHRAFELEFLQHKIAEIVVDRDVSILAVIGERMRETPGISGRLFDALGRSRVNVIAIAQGSSERNISVVVKREEVVKATQAIHRAFFENDDQIHVFLVGTGLIGSELLKQIGMLKDQNVQVEATMNSREMMLGKQMQTVDIERFIQYVLQFPGSKKVFVDATSSPDLPRSYVRLLQAGVSVVTPNKKAASGRMALYQELHDAQTDGSSFIYNTNVGAGLPILSTIRSLKETGDRIVSIEGVFSGTLSYLFNTYDGSGSFTALVEEARSNGLTEPDPRDDLSGMDVARKLLILAREMGLMLELEEIDVESLVDMTDEGIAMRAQNARSRGTVLRYLGSIRDGVVCVKLEEVASNHPTAHLRGCDNIAIITSSRYSDQPLVIQGPGAGAKVTAAGVLRDILSTNT